MWNVFIADDSALFRREMVDTFPWDELSCCVIGEADNGEDAEHMIRELHPDIVITDICMPCRGGLDMIEALSDVRDTEYIIVSAYSKFEYAMRVIKLRACDYLLKPINDAEMVETLKRVIARLEERQDEKRQIVTEPVNLAPEGHVGKVVRYIHEHYDHDLSIGDVARALFISESYVSKLCRRELNTGFSEYVKHVRIEKAMELLRSPGVRVYEVAARTGFRDYKYFCAVFKRHVGITPKQFQLSLKKRGMNS